MDEDNGACLFKNSTHTGLHWDKRPDFRLDFEPNQVNMFRVILEPNFVGELEEANQ